MYDEDTYEELQTSPRRNPIRSAKSRSNVIHTGTAMTPGYRRPATVNTGTSPIWNHLSPKREPLSPKQNVYNLNEINRFQNRTPNHVIDTNRVMSAHRQMTSSGRFVTSPPSRPPSIHKYPSSELQWCKYSSKESSLWESDTEDRTMYYSFADRQTAVSPSRRPPILEDFERGWPNVLVDDNTPDWSAVDSQQWRTWFEFYKANSKVCLHLY